MIENPLHHHKIGGAAAESANAFASSAKFEKKVGAQKASTAGNQDHGLKVRGKTGLKAFLKSFSIFAA